MSYSREVYDEAMAELNRRRLHALSSAAALRERMLQKNPRIAELEQRMASAASQVARVILQGGDPQAALKRIEEENLRTQQELRQLLHEAGEEADNFEPPYTCPQCEDTGYVGSRMCSCLAALLAEKASRRLSDVSGMKLTRFEDLDLGFYSDVPGEGGKSPRDQMAGVVEYCRCYAGNFGADSESLLLFGPTGTGKTHVALAIARVVVEQGFTVVYGPVQQLLHQMEKEHFGRAEGDSEDTMIHCDLLILDDIGTEMSTPFYQSCLYTLVNSRMLSGRATIISTNLVPADLQHRYGEQITSRIMGTFQPLLFVGGDIRQAKMQRRLEG